MKSKKSIDSIRDLESLLTEERSRPNYSIPVKAVKKSGYKPIILDGLEIANYETHGFPSMKNIKLVVEKSYIEGYTPITVICDSELRYILVEHENIKNLDKCNCEFCTAVNNQCFLIEEDEKITFLECLPNIESEKEILKKASNLGSKILTNKDLTKFKERYELLSNKNWQIKFEIKNNLVKLF